MIDTEGIMKIGLELANWKKIPYDSAIHVRGKSIRKVLLTVDVTIADLMLAKSMQCDAVIGHHPIGTAALNFHRVFDRHIDYMMEHNIPKDIAEHAVKKLKSKAELRSHANIYNDVVSAAKILKMPLINGGFPIAKAYFDYGVCTVIYLHIDYNDLTKLCEERLKGNLIVLGHLAGDSIGLNALADKLEDKKIDVVKLGIIPNTN
jgi:hypothetical protein